MKRCVFLLLLLTAALALSACGGSSRSVTPQLAAPADVESLKLVTLGEDGLTPVPDDGRFELVVDGMTARVIARDLTDCEHAYFLLRYPASEMTPLDMERGELLPQDDTIAFSISEEPGEVVLGFARIRPQESGGISGSGELFTVTFSPTPFVRAVDKETCRAPRTSRSIVPVTVTDIGGGVIEVVWEERNAGDYDLSGTVSIADITPVAVYYGKDTTDGTEDDYERPVDGDGSGTVGIADITPLAINYGNVLTGYNVYRLTGVGERLKLNETLMRREMNNGPGIYPTYSIQDSIAGAEYSVVSVDDQGEEGIDSRGINFSYIDGDVREVAPIPDNTFEAAQTIAYFSTVNTLYQLTNMEMLSNGFTDELLSRDTDLSYEEMLELEFLQNKLLGMEEATKVAAEMLFPTHVPSSLKETSGAGSMLNKLWGFFSFLGGSGGRQREKIQQLTQDYSASDWEQFYDYVLPVSRLPRQTDGTPYSAAEFRDKLYTGDFDTAGSTIYNDMIHASGMGEYEVQSRFADRATDQNFRPIDITHREGAEALEKGAEFYQEVVKTAIPGIGEGMDMAEKGIKFVERAEEIYEDPVQGIKNEITDNVKGYIDDAIKEKLPDCAGDWLELFFGTDSPTDIIQEHVGNLHDNNPDNNAEGTERIVIGMNDTGDPDRDVWITWDLLDFDLNLDNLDLPPGLWDFWLVSENGDTTNLNDVQIDAGDTTDIDFIFNPFEFHGAIIGQVRDTNDEPIANVNVQVEGDEGVITDITNPGGYYVLSNVPTGWKVVTFSARGLSTTNKVTVIALVPVTVNVVLPAYTGDVLEVPDISITMSQFDNETDETNGIYHIAGQVLNLDGPEILVMHNGSEEIFSVDVSGNFDKKVALVPGLNVMQIKATNALGTTYSAPMEVEFTRELIFRVTLTWNMGGGSDIDLYARDPSGDVSYYGHKGINSGNLDVDNMEGYGPENFTCTPDAETSLFEEGTYEIGVNYYTDDQADPDADPPIPPRVVGCQLRVIVNPGTEYEQTQYFSGSVSQHNSGADLFSSGASWWLPTTITVTDGVATIGG